MIEYRYDLLQVGLIQRTADLLLREEHPFWRLLLNVYPFLPEESN